MWGGAATGHPTSARWNSGRNGDVPRALRARKTAVLSGVAQRLLPRASMFAVPLLLAVASPVAALPPHDLSLSAGLDLGYPGGLRLGVGYELGDAVRWTPELIGGLHLGPADDSVGLRASVLGGVRCGLARWDAGVPSLSIHAGVGWSDRTALAFDAALSFEVAAGERARWGVALATVGFLRTEAIALGTPTATTRWVTDVGGALRLYWRWGP